MTLYAILSVVVITVALLAVWVTQRVAEENPPC